MEVIFIQTLKGQGQIDEVKKVNDGYALNFLIPRGYVIPATPGALKTLAEKQRLQQEEFKLGKAETMQLKTAIEAVHPLFRLTVSKDGQAQGAITAQDLIQTLHDDYKIDLSTKQFKNFKNLKKPGAVNVKVILDYGLQANLEFTIESK